MKLFIDTASIKEIEKVMEMGIIDGVTTNPTLVSRENRDFNGLLKEICSIVPGPVSAEVVGLDSKRMIEEARVLSKVASNIVVKIPMTAEGMKAVKILTDEEIKTNVTLVFSPLQALIAAKAGASYVSPFVGRLDDITHDGMSLVEDILTVYNNYGHATEVIVASVRSPMHLVDACMLGADIATVPYAVLQNIMKHPLTDIGLEKFLKDWENVPK